MYGRFFTPGARNNELYQLTLKIASYELLSIYNCRCLPFHEI